MNGIVPRPGVCLRIGGGRCVRGRLPDAGRDDLGAPGIFAAPPGRDGGAGFEARGLSEGAADRRALRATSAPNARIGEDDETEDCGAEAPPGRWFGSAVTTGSTDADGARPG
jgi:hypothetical protein